MNNLDELLQGNLSSYHENLKRVENLEHEIPDLGISLAASPEAKAKAKRDLFQRHKAEYERLAAAKRAEVEQNLHEARRGVFTPKIPGYSAAELALLRRDARDRLRGITDTSELSRVLDEASDDDDVVMAKEVLKKAQELGEHFGGAPLVDRYLEHFPGDRPNYERLVGAAQEATRIREMGVGFTPSDPEARARTFGGMSAGGSAGGGLLPENLVTSRVEDSAGDGSIPEGIPVAE